MVMPVTGVVSWTVIDDSWKPVAPVERYLAHLAGIERSPNTVRAYAFGLRFWPSAATSEPSESDSHPSLPLDPDPEGRISGHGFRRFDHYRLRVLLHTGGVTWPERPSPPRIRTRQSPLR